MNIPHWLLLFSEIFSIFVNTVGFFAISARLLIKSLPKPKDSQKNYKYFLNVLGHIGLTFGDIYSDI